MKVKISGILISKFLESTLFYWFTKAEHSFRMFLSQEKCASSHTTHKFWTSRNNSEELGRGWTSGSELVSPSWCLVMPLQLPWSQLPPCNNILIFVDLHSIFLVHFLKIFQEPFESFCPNNQTISILKYCYRSEELLVLRKPWWLHACFCTYICWGMSIFTLTLGLTACLYFHV